MYSRIILSSLAFCITVSPAIATDRSKTMIAKAHQFVLAALPGQCSKDYKIDNPLPFGDAARKLSWKDKDARAGDPPHKATLYKIFCIGGAYNVTSVFVIKKPDDPDMPFELVTFAKPEISYEYKKLANGDVDYARLEKVPRIDGFSTTAILVNANYDPKTKMISEFDKWRGLGDAWSSGEWSVEYGRAILESYTVDPTYEANLDHPTKAQREESYKVYP